MCDLAETYNIYNYKQLPATLVAVYVVGLRDDSRIKMKLANQKVNFTTLLLASAVDRLSLLLWSKTKDGQKGRNRPKSIVDMLNKQHKQPENLGFSSGEEFEKARQQLLRKEELSGN